MNRRRVAALLRALADEIDEPVTPKRDAPALPPVADVDDVAHERARRALRRQGLVGSSRKGAER